MKYNNSLTGSPIQLLDLMKLARNRKANSLFQWSTCFFCEYRSFKMVSHELINSFFSQPQIEMMNFDRKKNRRNDSLMKTVCLTLNRYTNTWQMF